MPRATVMTDTVKHELKTCPGAWVLLRPLSYGKKLARQEQATRMTLKAQQGPRRRGQSPDADTEISLLSRAAALLDFRECVVDHNLEDADGRKLDFRNLADFDNLDPRIGEEIGKLLDELNNFEDEDDQGNFEPR
jgi:hypothetical protein